MFLENWATFEGKTQFTGGWGSLQTQKKSTIKKPDIYSGLSAFYSLYNWCHCHYRTGGISCPFPSSEVYWKVQREITSTHALHRAQLHKESLRPKIPQDLERWIWEGQKGTRANSFWFTHKPFCYGHWSHCQWKILWRRSHWVWQLVQEFQMAWLKFGLGSEVRLDRSQDFLLQDFLRWQILHLCLLLLCLKTTLHHWACKIFFLHNIFLVFLSPFGYIKQSGKVVLLNANCMQHMCCKKIICASICAIDPNATTKSRYHILARAQINRSTGFWEMVSKQGIILLSMLP